MAPKHVHILRPKPMASRCAATNSEELRNIQVRRRILRGAGSPKDWGEKFSAYIWHKILIYLRPQDNRVQRLFYRDHDQSHRRSGKSSGDVSIWPRVLSYGCECFKFIHSRESWERRKRKQQREPDRTRALPSFGFLLQHL